MKIFRLKSTSELEIISQVVKVLNAGGLIIFPTETVYGLGADATNQQAVNQLLKFKGQRNKKPISIAVSDQAMAEKYVHLNKVSRNLYQKFLPGPLTIISRTKLPKSPKLADGIQSLESTIGVRIPDYPLIIKVIERLNRPITATSANISGAKNPRSLSDIQKTTPSQKLKFIDLFIDAGKLPWSRPSTVINTSQEDIEIVRRGPIKFQSAGRPQKTETFLSNSPNETIRIGKSLITKVLNSTFNIQHLPLIILLQGQLGAGKTVFAKGIARALDITGPISSPSYTLIKEYQSPITDHRSPITFYHIDAWRLHIPAELADLSLEKMLKPGNTIAIEWAEKFGSFISKYSKKAKIIQVQIKINGEKERKIHIC